MKGRAAKAGNKTKPKPVFGSEEVRRGEGKIKRIKWKRRGRREGGNRKEVKEAK